MAGAAPEGRDGTPGGRAGTPGGRAAASRQRGAASRPQGAASRRLGLIFIGAGLNHFVMPRAYRQIVPPSLGDTSTQAKLVTVSGVAEVLGGVGVLLPRTRRLSGLGLIALLVAVFPANLYMARNPEQFKRIPRWALYARLALQPLMIWSVWRITRGERS